MKKGLLTFAIGSAIVGALVYLCKSVKEEVTVHSLGWERSVDLEEFKEVEEKGDWVPEGATVTNVETETVKESAQKIVKKIVCYTYVVKKWVKLCSCLSSGDNTEKPYYDEIDSLPENRRYTNKKETYFFYDTNGNRWELPYEKWEVLCIGERVRIFHGRLSNTIHKLERC